MQVPVFLCYYSAFSVRDTLWSYSWGLPRPLRG